MDRALGLTAGIPDCFLALPRLGFHGLYVEFKTAKGRVSDRQVLVMEELRAQGYRVEIVRSLEEFQVLIAGYM